VKRSITALFAYLLPVLLLTGNVPAAWAADVPEEDEVLTSSLKAAFSRDHEGGVLVIDSDEAEVEAEDGGDKQKADDACKDERGKRSYPQGVYSAKWNTASARPTRQA